MRTLSLVLILFSATLASAQIQDFVCVFSADGIPYRPDKGHTFAAVVRVETHEGKPARAVEVASISWLPATMKVRALALKPEQGRNVPLDETLRVYADKGHKLCMWGPYRVQPEFFELFKTRVAQVEQTFGYKAAALTSPRDICDCARAVEEMVESRRRLIGVNGYGAAASSVVVRKFSPWLIEPDQSHAWVEPLMGLDEYPLVRRSYGDYTTRGDQFKASLRRN